MFFSTQRIFKERGILSKYLSSAEKKIIRHKELNMHRVEIGISFDYYFFYIRKSKLCSALKSTGNWAFISY